MIIDLPTVKTFLGITDTSEDAQLTLFLDYADAEIKDYVGWDIEQATYPGCDAGGRGDSGYYCGDFSQYLRLRQTPVISITNIYFDPLGRFGQNPDGSFAAETLLTYGSDYVLHYDGCLIGTSTPCSYSGMVERLATTWQGGVRRQIGEVTSRLVPADGNIFVQYVAGYPIVPKAIEMAACMFIAYIRRNAQTGGLNIGSESQGAYSYSLSSPQAGQIPELGSVRGALARFRRPVI